LANILSQNEIDDLLMSLSLGEADAVCEQNDIETAQIKEYNFRTANKFPKEQIRTLHFIFENYSNLLSYYLSGHFRSACEVKMLSIEEQTFSEFSNSIPEPSILSIISLPPLQGPALFVISSSIAYAMIARVFGGKGRGSNVEKQFTEIEFAILQRIIKQMLSCMDEAWKKIIKIKTVLDRVETSAQFTQIVAANEPIAIATLNVSIGGISDLIHICIPHVAVQLLSKQLTMKTVYSDFARRNDEEKPNREMRPGMLDTPLTLKAVFNTTTGPVSDILKLKEGDIICLDHGVDKPVTIMVEHIPKFKGKIGTSASKYAVHVQEILKEETRHEGS
jgi:flagellar motor switch protein FliM